MLQSPNHPTNQQPYYYLALRNVTRNALLWFTFNLANQPGVPWKVTKDAATGLAIETAILFPLAIAWLSWLALASQPVMGLTSRDTHLLLLSGIASTTPLVLFAAAARRLPYSTLGMLQFLTPTLQFLIAVLLYGEPFTTAHAIAFPTIWLALLLYVVAMVRSPKLPQPPE